MDVAANPYAKDYHGCLAMKYAIMNRDTDSCKSLKKRMDLDVLTKDLSPKSACPFMWMAERAAEMGPELHEINDFLLSSVRLALHHQEPEN